MHYVYKQDVGGKMLEKETRRLRKAQAKVKQKQDMASRTVLGNNMFLGTGFTSEAHTAAKIPKKTAAHMRARQEGQPERVESRIE